MTNDTNTLTGALKEAGETLAANLTTQGVPSTWDEGLTTLIGKVLDITPGPGPTPTPSSISLTADKSILSYADSESATLSATVLDSNDDPMEGVTVTFYNGSTSMGTADTDSSGVATKTYASAGSGDVSFTAEVGSLSSETYSIKDAVYYNSGTLTSSQILNIPNIPQNFKATWKLKPVTSSTNSWLEIGTDSNNLFFAGQVGNNVIGIYKKVNGTQNYITYDNLTLSQSTEYPVEMSYNNGTITFKANNKTETVNYTLTDRTYSYIKIQNNQFKELLIMPL